VGERNWERVDCRRVHSGRCVISGADWMLLGDSKGREKLVGERNLETVDCRRVHSGSCMVSGSDWMLLGD